MSLKIVRPDSKGRVTLGHLASGVSGYTITETKEHKLILEPYVEIPARERWLFDNKAALKKVESGLKDAAAGRLSEKGSFAKFSDDDIE
jgi:hypothetical protein